MRNRLSYTELSVFLLENDGSIGFCLGMTDPDSREWSFIIYVGNGYFLILYDERKGINNSGFDQILNIDRITKEKLKNTFWASNNVYHLHDFVNLNLEFVCYDLNIIDICIEKKLDIKNLIKVLKHNLEQIHIMEEGDVVSFERGFYSHHALLTDKAYMIVTHKWGEPENPAGGLIASKSIIGIPTEKACVSEDFLIEVAGYRKLNKSNHLYDTLHMPKPKEEILREAKNRLGEIGYSVTTNNCQNFVSSIRNGVSRSPEVESVKNGIINASIIGFAGLVASSLYLFSKSKNQKDKNSQNENEQ